jgi:hypothetical protein
VATGLGSFPSPYRMARKRCVHKGSGFGRYTVHKETV